MTYTEFVRDQLQDIPVSQPIYSKNIAANLSTTYGLSPKNAASATSVAFRRIINNGSAPMLRRYKRGVYYFTADTPFGEVGIDRGRLMADKYLLPDNGYETDYSELYRIGLTTQIPRRRYFASNNVSHVHIDKNLGILVRPSKTKIDHNNKTALQFLDVLSLMDKAPIDADNPYAILANYMKKKKLRYKFLLSLAHNHYDQNTIRQLDIIAHEGNLK